jgi:hypothetical protein
VLAGVAAVGLGDWHTGRAAVTAAGQWLRWCAGVSMGVLV